MRLVCSRNDLYKALSMAGRAVAARSTLPILTHIKLDASGDDLTVAATNLEIGIRCSIQAGVSEDGAITVPAKLVQEFVRNLSGDEVEMELVRGEKLKFSCGRHTANIKGLDPNEFPAFCPDGSVPSVTVQAEPLRRMIEQVVFSAAGDESRPVLAGVYVKLSGMSIIMATTDGYRLSVRHDDLPEATEDMEAIVPAQFMREIARAVGQADAHDVGIGIEQARIMAFVGNTVVVSQLVAGNFPDYAAIIPKTHTTRVVVDTDTFSRAVAVSKLFTNTETGILALRIDPECQHIVLIAQAADIGDNEATVEASVEGPALEIAFSSKYLLEALSAMGHGNTIMEVSTAASPGLLHPDGLEESLYTHVIMPMRMT